eukprot:m.835144 g.835144  ORF g.835144 m.835144 type:complete len:183 (+) comp23452_c0_seq20:1625-2173(+)
MRYDSGAAFLPVGLEVDWLFALGLEPDTAAPALEDFVGGLADVGFNHVLMNVFANQSAWNQGLAPLTPPRVSPTHTTPWAGGAPLDYDTLDTRFFAHVDRTLTVLLQHNMTANLMLYVGNKAVQWPARNSPADDLYWRYCMARCVVGWHGCLVRYAVSWYAACGVRLQMLCSRVCRPVGAHQ